MADTNVSLVNLGDLSMPATVLIEKVSDAVGAIFLPTQIIRVAKAKAEADKTKAITQIEIDDLKMRALNRVLKEESDKQKNIESITAKAIPLLEEGSKPNEFDKDWLVNFFDKAKLISGSEMQELWGKILAGEANMPGTYSRRTINQVASLDKQDAEIFSTLCNFIWEFSGVYYPFILDLDAEVYKKNGITFPKLKHLDSIGLVSFEPLSGYRFREQKGSKQLSYMGKPVNVKFVDGEKSDLSIGTVILSNVGQELSHVCNIKKIPDLYKYVIETWKSQGNLVEN